MDDRPQSLLTEICLDTCTTHPHPRAVPHATAIEAGEPRSGNGDPQHPRAQDTVRLLGLHDPLLLPFSYCYRCEEEVEAARSSIHCWLLLHAYPLSWQGEKRHDDHAGAWARVIFVLTVAMRDAGLACEEGVSGLILFAI